ncbi:MAG: 16S rRNA (guanine(527)-N(7))-methyltransferase RsmG [Planctomycetes bacterium]|nr:16S rRNA (guanine(527)-N(7))-methyltransferase RsmG [Planctomycetota bacterium]
MPAELVERLARRPFPLVDDAAAIASAGPEAAGEMGALLAGRPDAAPPAAAWAAGFLPESAAPALAPALWRVVAAGEGPAFLAARESLLLPGAENASAAWLAALEHAAGKPDAAAFFWLFGELEHFPAAARAAAIAVARGALASPDPALRGRAVASLGLLRAEEFDEFREIVSPLRDSPDAEVAAVAKEVWRAVVLAPPEPPQPWPALAALVGPRFRLALGREEIDALVAFREIVARANEHLNLTRLVAPEDFAWKQAFDSLAMLLAAPELLRDTTRRILDVGSGGGFPGLALAIALPRHEVTLLEKTVKKARFLKDAVAELELDNVRVEERQLQEFAARCGAVYHVATVRAVERVDALVRPLAHALIPRGKALFYRGPDAALDAPLLAGFRQAATLLDGPYVTRHRFDLPVGDLRRRFLIGVRRATPTKRHRG